MKHRYIDIRGKRFGSIVPIEPAGKSSSRSILWRCICDCGSEFISDGAFIRLGRTISCPSCGARRTGDAQIKHNSHSTPEYRAWCDMKARCNNKKHKSYKHYGGRGINVCERWMESFENFIADMGKRISNEYSLDRIDNNKGYSPENCRWATVKEQACNKRGKKIISHNGVEMSVAEWSRKLGLPASTIQYRISYLGWSTDAALTKGVKNGTP